MRDWYCASVKHPALILFSCTGAVVSIFVECPKAISVWVRLRLLFCYCTRKCEENVLLNNALVPGDYFLLFSLNVHWNITFQRHKIIIKKKLKKKKSNPSCRECYEWKSGDFPRTIGTGFENVLFSFSLSHVQSPGLFKVLAVKGMHCGMFWSQ